MISSEKNPQITQIKNIAIGDCRLPIAAKARFFNSTWECCLGRQNRQLTIGNWQCFSVDLCSIMAGAAPLPETCYEIKRRNKASR